MTKERLWTKDFVTAFAINFLVYLIFFILMVIIASYAVDKFDASVSVAGLVSSIFVVGVLIGRLGTGRIIEDIGSKKVLILGTMFYIITSVLYFAAINLTLLIIIRLLHGIAYGVASTATGTIVAQIIPHSRRGEGVGYYTMSAILATALGPFIGILLIQYIDFKMIFIVTSILASISFAISFLVSGPTYKTPGQDQVRAVNSFNISYFLEFKVIPISIIALIIGFCYSVVLAFISLYTKQIHLVEAASFFFLVFAIAIIVSRPFSGRLLDVKGANFVIYPCLLLFAMGMLLYSQTNQGITLLLAAAMIGLGYGNFMSCGQAIAIKAVPHHRLGLATATYFIFVDLGVGIGPYLLGALVPFTGYRGLYLIMTILVLADVVFYYFLHGRKASSA
jgi:MFS family permease